ncbi:unnamed protein product, partial [Mesorhabditis spiculigera]
MTAIRLSLVCLVVVASAVAHYVPPYYGEHDSAYGDHDNQYGDYHGNKGHHADGYEEGKYGGNYGQHGHQGSEYYDKGHGNGEGYYADGGAHGEGDNMYDAGHRQAADEDGYKKYSFYSSGSGPYGAYQKGYYGSEGYEHEDSDSAHKKATAGGAYKKKYSEEGHEKDHGKEHYDKAAKNHAGHEDKYASEKHGHEHKGYGAEEHKKVSITHQVYLNLQGYESDKYGHGEKYEKH